MNIIAKMPTKAHLAKFAYWTEGTQPINLRSNLVISHFIKQHLVGKESLTEFDHKISANYKSTLLLQINPDKVERGRLFLTRRSIISINQLLHGMFLESMLLRAMFFKLKEDVDYRTSIRNFCEELDIDLEIDISAQTIYRQFSRYKLAKKEAFQRGIVSFVP